MSWRTGATASSITRESAALTSATVSSAASRAFGIASTRPSSHVPCTRWPSLACTVNSRSCPCNFRRTVSPGCSASTRLPDSGCSNGVVVSTPGGGDEATTSRSAALVASTSSVGAGAAGGGAAGSTTSEVSPASGADGGATTGAAGGGVSPASPASGGGGGGGMSPGGTTPGGGASGASGSGSSGEPAPPRLRGSTASISAWASAPTAPPYAPSSAAPSKTSCWGLYTPLAIRFCAIACEASVAASMPPAMRIRRSWPTTA